MKFCARCGRKLNDEDNFCPSCGKPQDGGTYTQNELNRADKQAGLFAEAQNGAVSDGISEEEPVGTAPEEKPVYTYDARESGRPFYVYDGQVEVFDDRGTYGEGVQPEKVRRKKKRRGGFNKKLIPVIAAGGLAVILLLVFLFRGIFGGGSLTREGAVRSYYKAMQSGKGERVLDATMSDGILDAVMEKTGFTRTQIVKLLDKANTVGASKTDYEKGYRNVVITKETKCDDEDIDNFVDSIKSATDVNVRISAMYEVKVEYQVWNTYYDEWQTATDDIMLYRSGGSWYVMQDMIEF